MDPDTLLKAASQWTLEDVIQHGQQSGRSPEEVAGAVRKWRDGARAWGEQSLRESDPKKWFVGNQKLDARIRDEMAAIQGQAIAETVSEEIRDPDRRLHFSHFLETHGDNPDEIPDPQFRDLAKRLRDEVIEAPAYTIPDAKDRVIPLETETGVMLGDFEAQARPDGKGLDLLFRFDDEGEESGSFRKAITMEDVTAEEVEAAAAEANTQVERLRPHVEHRESIARLATDTTDPMHGVNQKRAEDARKNFDELSKRADALSNPHVGRLLLLRERVEERIKEDPDLKTRIGDVDLWDDFMRGVQQTRMGVRMAALDIADLAGADVGEDKEGMRNAIGALNQMYPGSTNWQFRGGAGAFASDTASVLGGMTLTMAASLLTGGAGVAAGGLSRGAAVAARAGAITPISLSAYGNSYAAMLNDADALEARGDHAGAEQRRRDARAKAFADASIETASEMVFPEEMLGFMTRGGFVGKVAKGAAQNAVEESLASIGQGATDRAYRDIESSWSDVGRDAALGAVVGGVMQVPGGIVEVFLPTKEEAGSPPPPPESSERAGDPPPPSSGPAATGPGASPPPPDVEVEPDPSVSPSSSYVGDTAIYRVGARQFNWGVGGWREAGQDGDSVLTDPGLIAQLDAARERLNSGEQPMPQSTALAPGETPTILDVDGRSFLPAPSGRGWLEVFPDGSADPRLVNFAFEGEPGIAILRRLNAKMAELQATTEDDGQPGGEEVNTPETPAAESPESPEPPDAEASPPAALALVEDDPAPTTTHLDEVEYPTVEVPVDEITLSEDVPNFKEGADPATGVVPGEELGGSFQRLGIQPIVVWERLDGRREVITGRHRLDLARRSGETTIPAQIVREADGFGVADALVFDAASNIRDGQGNVRDYARFFRHSPDLTRAEAESSGLLARAKGRAGWHLGKSATDGLFSLYRARKITEARALAIAETAPNDEAAQRIGIRYALEKKDPAFIANVMKASGAESTQRGETMDLFGEDDAAMIEMERRAARASQFQKTLQDQITAAQSAAKRPEAARRMGIDVSDPAAVQERIAQLRQDVVRWQNWPMHRDLVALVNGDAPVTAEAASPGQSETTESEAQPDSSRTSDAQAPAEAEGQLVPEAEMPFNLAGETITEPEPVEPPDTRTDAERDADTGQGRFFEDRPTPAQPPESAVRQLLNEFLARHPEKRPRPPAERTEEEQRRMDDVSAAVSAYFGGDVPAGVRVVWEPDAVWDALYDRGAGVIQINAALVRPGEEAFKIEHEIGHALFQDPSFVAAFEALWNALPKIQQDRISKKVERDMERGYYSQGDAFEETRVRALEAIRRMAAGDHATPAVKRAWAKFVKALTEAWQRITGRPPLNPERIAASMIQIGVGRMRSRSTGGGEGVALSTIDFDGFKAWALDGIEPDGFVQEDAGRLWVAADVDGNVNMLFGSFADADEYFRTNSGRGEFLWDVTESYERMVGGIPERTPDGPTQFVPESNVHYGMPKLPGETPAEAGNLPRVSPTGQAVTAALLPDMGLRYGLVGFDEAGRLQGAVENRRLPDPNKPHRKRDRVFSVAEPSHGPLEPDPRNSGPILSLNDAVSREQSQASQSLADLESAFRVSFFAGDFDGAAAAMDRADAGAFESFARKLVRFSGAGDLDASGMLEWVRHANAGTRPDVAMDQELADLIKAMRARFPHRPAARPTSGAMADHRERHYSSADFENAFARHVAAGDFQGAYEAVRDSDDSVRIPALRKWMKAARRGDATAQKNFEWLAAIFNGTVPPGVTAPATPAGATPSQDPSPQSPPPPPPPPVQPINPPPRPNGVEKLNIPALVFLARKMGTIPLVGRFAARGQFRPSDKRGEVQTNPAVRVNEFLGKEDWQQAARTLAHEIGHFIDYVINAVPNADIVKRLVPLKSARDSFIKDVFGEGTKYSAARKYMMAEAVAISKLMRGDFAPDDKYRNASVELYADFLSAIMIDPDLAFDTAPLLSHAWFAHLDQKPSADNAWNLVQTLIKGDALHEAIRADREADQNAAMRRQADRADHNARRNVWWKKIGTGLIGSLWSRYTPAGAKKVNQPGWRENFRFTARWWEAVTNPKEEDFVANMEGAEIEASQKGSVLRLKIQKHVYDPLRRHGIGLALLDEYLSFFQIIHEDTATRRYLEENPDEFREFLLWLDETANLDRAGEINAATDSDLDQIGASMVGSIQLNDRFDGVYAAAQRRDAPDIAERGLFAFDIARYQWNQDGHTPETAKQGMDYLRRELGVDRFNVLRDAAKAFHQNLESVVREAHDVGLFTERTWSEKIEPNLGNYVPRMVLEYFTGELSATIKQRRGSLKGTLPKHLAGEGQAMTLLHKISKQKQMRFILQQASDLGWANEIEVISKIPKGHSPASYAKHLRQKESRALRGYYRNGKWTWLAFEDPDVVQWLDAAGTDDLQWMLDMAKANENVWRVWTTVLKASFALWNNPVRTIKTGLIDFSYRAPQWAYSAVRQFPEAISWARASLGLEVPTDRVIDLVERGVLPAFGQYVAADLRTSNEDLVAQIAEGLTGIEALRKGKIAKGPVGRAALATLNAPGIRQAVQALSLFSGTFEALPKLATEDFWNNRDVPQWERDRLSRMEGIPNTGLSAGKYGTWAGTVSLFYRVWAQGQRRLATLPFNPRTRGMFWTGNLLGVGLIKAFYHAAGAGLIDAMMGGDDDEDRQTDWQEAYTRASNYKLTHGDALFFGWTLPGGGYEPPWGHAAIPSDWIPLFLRLPVSESGRLSEPLSMMAMGRLFPDSPLNASTDGEAARRRRDLAAALLPSSNPVFENLWYAGSIGDPKSPRDPYSGRDVVPKDEWDSGMTARVTGIAKHFLEQTPAGNFAPAMRDGIANERDMPVWLRSVISIPGVSAALAADNRQLAADYIQRIEERDTINRKARNLRGSKTKQAVSMRSRLNRIPAESRTDAEQVKIDILNQWYNREYLGTDSLPGYFRELQAHAAGMDGIDVERMASELDETAAEALRDVGRIER